MTYYVVDSFDTKLKAFSTFSAAYDFASNKAYFWNENLYISTVTGERLTIVFP